MKKQLEEKLDTRQKNNFTIIDKGMDCILLQL